MNNIDASSLLPAIVFLPLIAAIVSFVLGQNRSSRAITLCFAVLQFLLVVSMSWLFFEARAYQSSRYEIGNWGAPLGIDLSVDGLSILMILLTGVLTPILSFYSAEYFSKNEKSYRFWPLWWLLITGLNGLFVSSDAFNIYVCLELIGLSAAALVALQATRAALEAALRYLLVGLLGSLFYLMAVTLLYRSYGTLDLQQIAALSNGGLTDGIVMSLLTIGLLLKVALFPLHFWLPSAHANAPTSVSAILSALVVKAPLYVLIEFWFEVLPAAITPSASQALGMLGGIAIIYGSWQAFHAERLKVMIAYSTVAQLGYIFLLFPLSVSTSASGSFSSSASLAAIYFIVAHACAKAAMFLAAGNLILSQGDDRIQALAGIATREPVNVLIFAIAGVSLVGLPPSAGFIAKWLLLTSSVQNGQWWWVFIVVSGGLIASTYLFKVLSLAFKQDYPSAEPTTVRTRSKIPITLTLAALLLALITIALGLNAQLILDLSSPIEVLPSIANHGGDL